MGKSRSKRQKRLHRLARRAGAPAAGARWSLPHAHVGSPHDKAAYLALKARLYSERGTVLLCSHCDPYLLDVCALSGLERQLLLGIGRAAGATDTDISESANPEVSVSTMMLNLQTKSQELDETNGNPIMNYQGSSKTETEVLNMRENSQQIQNNLTNTEKEISTNRIETEYNKTVNNQNCDSQSVGYLTENIPNLKNMEISHESQSSYSKGREDITEKCSIATQSPVSSIPYTNQPENIGIGPQILLQSQPQKSTAYIIQQTASTSSSFTSHNAPQLPVRKGVPRTFNFRMMGEATQPQYDVIEISSSDDDMDGSSQGNIPDLLLPVYQSPSPDAITQLSTSQIVSTQGDDLNVNTLTVTPELLNSEDKTVTTMLKRWPWAKELRPVQKLSYEDSDEIREMEFHYMMNCYNDSSTWIQITVTGYPEDWSSQQVLNAIVKWQMLEDMVFVPCFVEFTSTVCRFLVHRNPDALEYLHISGLICQMDDIILCLTIQQLALNINELKFNLQKFLFCRLVKAYNRYNNSVDLTAFLLGPDISQICYYPLNKSYNQKHIFEINNKITWSNITKLILKSNKLRSINHFHIPDHMPYLKELDLSDNELMSACKLSCCRGIPLSSLSLEGNPLCLNFIHADRYLEVVKLLFPTIVYLDGVKVSGAPNPLKNFCQSPEAMPVVEIFLQGYFTLLESKQKKYISDMYSERAILTISCHPKMKNILEYGHIEPLKSCRDIRLLNKIMELSIKGYVKITEYLEKWPRMFHDRYSFNVDVLHHSKKTTILTITGLFKVLGDPPIPANDTLLDFSRTFVLHTRDGAEYCIENDMWYIGEPSKERREAAFKEPVPIQKPPSLKLKDAPDDYLKTELVLIFMKLTELNRHHSTKCLEMRNWHFKEALELFIQLGESGVLAKLSQEH